MKSIYLLAFLLFAGHASNKSDSSSPEIESLNCGDVSVTPVEPFAVCQSGEQFTLDATFPGAFIDALWTPSENLDTPDQLNTTGNIDTTTTFTIRVRSLSEENLITNGDFSEGNTGFTTDYLFSTVPGNLGLLTEEGRYVIDTDASNTHNRFASCRSDAPSGGNMMVINASGNPDRIWCQDITVNTNTTYQFGAFVASVNDENPAQLQFSINNDLLGNNFTASSTTCVWEEFSAVWDSQDQTSATICIVNVNNTPNGNDFALDDITFSPVCETTAITTVTVANLNPSWTAPNEICQNEAPILLDEFLDSTASPGGNWTIDGSPATLLDPQTLTAGPHQFQYTVALAQCMEELTQVITILEAPDPGREQQPLNLCQNENTVVDLSTLLEEEDSGGEWRETSTTLSTGNAFDPIAGTFNTEGQIAQVYAFVYEFPNSLCSNASTPVNVLINPLPVSDAGSDQLLGCSVDMVTLGSSATSEGNDISYQWSALSGANLPQATMSMIEVQTPDTYFLEVTNDITGCSSIDSVTVDVNAENITASIAVREISCFGDTDGIIQVDQIDGGTSPYRFALNGGPLDTKPEFNELGAGTYVVLVEDQNGCSTSLEVELTEPEPLEVNLTAITNNTDNIVNLGDSVQLNLQINLPIGQTQASVVWEPAISGCTNCTMPFVQPTTNTTYTATVTDESGCGTTASIALRVEAFVNVFIPNAFSPNNDGRNDLFMIFAGQEVMQIKAFQVADRWGNIIFQANDFAPNDPTFGWDGTVDGQLANAGVYVYAIEIELANGETLVEKGDISLLY